MPPNTILLSQMMRELSSHPGFTETLLAEIDSASKRPDKKGPALLTPDLADDLRKRILGKDWERLDRFPGWSMREINPTVRVAGHFAGKNEKLEAASAVHPGAIPAAATAHDNLDLGPYDLHRSATISLEAPPNPHDFPPFTTEGIVTSLGAGVTRGDGPNDLAPEHAASQRLAAALNRLAANKLDGAEPFAVEHRAGLDASTRNAETSTSTPEGVIAGLQATGHTVTVIDARYFANFGHLHYNGQDVMMPFWVDSKLIVPRSGGRHLLVPVAHAEYEWQIRGPQVNADISWYFGIDGKAEWRTMDTLDQAWVLKRAAHTYTGVQAVEVTRLAGLLTVAYMHLHATHPALPFGGYYALGVCQDGVSAIEHHMTGSVTLFPNTADTAFFNDPRDAEVNALLAAIPKDRDGAPPPPERIFGSLPTDPGANADFSAVTIPGLAADLQATHAAWKSGKLQRSPLPLYLGAAAALALCAFAFYGLRHRR